MFPDKLENKFSKSMDFRSIKADNLKEKAAEHLEVLGDTTFI